MQGKEKALQLENITRLKYNQNKDKTKLSQLEKVFKAFYEKPRTMKEVDEVSGVMRENICRYVSKLKAKGQIFLVSRKKCTVTKEWAGVYTTNPDLALKFNIPNQLSLEV